MLWARLLYLIAFVVAILAQKRIMGGSEVHKTNKKYMVYLIRSKFSPRKFEGWTCGGAIVTKWHIVTSAACIEDAQNIAVIAGNRKFITRLKVLEDGCIQPLIKRIVSTCVPKGYEFNYEKVEKWAYIDIGVGKVESEYKFGDNVLYQSCSYAPEPILVNYDPKYQQPGVNAIVLGWGHAEKWRKENDPIEYNQDMLHYAPVKIEDKKNCKPYFAEQIGPVIDKYMICTMKAGNWDDGGHTITRSKPIADGCTPKVQKLKENPVCMEDENTNINETGQIYDTRKTFSRILERQKKSNHEKGICQNDHGGPLVSWVGSQEVLIGVASVFRVTSESKCTGPFLYTSSYCSGAFLYCLLQDHTNGSRRNPICDLPPSERGFYIINRTVSWDNYTDGPTEEERNETTPQPKLPT